MTRPLVLTALLFAWTFHSHVDAQILRRQINRGAPLRIYRQQGNRLIGQPATPTVPPRQLPPAKVLAPQIPSNRLPSSSPRIGVPGQLTVHPLPNAPAPKSSPRPIVRFRNMPLLRLPDGVVDDPTEFYESIGGAPPAGRPSQVADSPNQIAAQAETLPGPAPQLPVYEVNGAPGTSPRVRQEPGRANGVADRISDQPANVVSRDATAESTIRKEPDLQPTLTYEVVQQKSDASVPESTPDDMRPAETNGDSTTPGIDDLEQGGNTESWGDDDWEKEDWAQEDWAKEEWNDDDHLDFTEADAGYESPDESVETNTADAPLSSASNAGGSVPEETFDADSQQQDADWGGDSVAIESAEEETAGEEWANEDWGGEEWANEDWEGEDWAKETADDEGTTESESEIDWDSEAIDEDVVLDVDGMEDPGSVDLNDSAASSEEMPIAVDGTIDSPAEGSEENESASWQWILALGPVMLLPIAWFWWKRQRKQDDFISATARPTKDAQPNLIESNARPAQQPSPSPAKSRPSHDDLTRLRGITPPVSALLNALGIRTFQKLSESKANELRAVIEKGGLQGKVLDPSVWIQQAWFAARDDWPSLEKWQTMNGHLFQQTQQTQQPQPATQQPQPAPSTPPQATPTQSPSSKPAQDDLTRIRGIDANLATHLAAKGIGSFVQLASQDAASLRALVSEVGPNYASVDPQPWPGIAALASRGDWEKVQQLNTALEQGILDTTNSIFETLSQAVRPASNSTRATATPSGTETTPYSEVLEAMGKSADPN